MIKIRQVLMTLGLLSLAACVTRREEEKPVKTNEATAADVAGSLGNPLLANKGDINAVNVSVSSEEELKKIDNGSDDELVWTNPDDPDAEIPGLNI